jgi:hypothetical protein
MSYFSIDFTMTNFQWSGGEEQCLEVANKKKYINRINLNSFPHWPLHDLGKQVHATNAGLCSFWYVNNDN